MRVSFSSQSSHRVCVQSLIFSPDVPSITKSVVNHVHTSLARQAYNLDNLGAYQAAARSVRDNLLVRRMLWDCVTEPPR